MKYFYLMMTVIFMVLPKISFAQNYNGLEYYFTPEKDACLIAGSVSPFDIGNRIANGEALLREYVFLLDSKEFYDDFFAEPLDLSYAFFLIAKRIGDVEADKKIQWLKPYVPDDRRETVTSIIYRKFSTPYLKKCFAARQSSEVEKAFLSADKDKEKGKNTKKPPGYDQIYELYMYSDY